MDRQSKNNTPILAPSGTLPVPRLWTPSHRRMLQSASSREISWAKNALQDMTMIWHDDTPQESYVFLKAMEDQLGLGKVRMHPASMGKQSQEVKSLLKLLSPAIWPEWSTQERITKAFWISQWAESTVTPICLSKNERTDVNGQPPDDSWPAIHGCCDQISNTWNILNGMSPQTLCQHVEVLAMELSLAQIFSVTWLIEIIIQCQVHREKSHEMKPGKSSFETSNV